MRRFPDGPLDKALERLRYHGLPYRWSERDLKLWEAVCPACRVETYALRIRESLRDGPITLRCSSGCTADEISDALDRAPADPRVDEAIALAEDARAIAAETLELLGVAA